MLVEAIEKPVIYRWPGGGMTLRPGQPVEVPEDRARKLLAKADGKVRAVTIDWLKAFRELARLTEGIEVDDERFLPIMQQMNKTDESYQANDWAGFQRAADEVRRIVRGQS